MNHNVLVIGESQALCCMFQSLHNVNAWLAIMNSLLDKAVPTTVCSMDLKGNEIPLVTLQRMGWV